MPFPGCPQICPQYLPSEKLLPDGIDRPVHRRLPRATTLLALALWVVACTQKVPLPDVGSDPDLLFTFFDNSAEMRTVASKGDVALEARAAVMVVDAQRRLTNDQIYVTDLREPQKDGRFTVWIEPRSTWLDRAKPKLSQIKQLADAGGGDAEDDDTAAEVVASTREQADAKKRPRRSPVKRAAKVGRPQVVMFGTSWCPACRVAGQYFKSRGIPYEELDVEKDPQAARRFAAAQQAHNLRGGSVPLIIVNGRAFQGFSQQHIEAALAAPRR